MYVCMYVAMSSIVIYMNRNTHAWHTEMVENEYENDITMPIVIAMYIHTHTHTYIHTYAKPCMRA